MRIAHFFVLLAKVTLFLCIKIKKKICNFHWKLVKFPPNSDMTKKLHFHN